MLLGTLVANLLGSALNLFRIGFSEAAHGWVGCAKGSPVPKNCHRLTVPKNCHLKWWNLVQLYLTWRRSKKYMSNMKHPLSSADISVSSPEIRKFCYIKKYRYRVEFDTQFLILLAFVESLKVF